MAHINKQQIVAATREEVLNVINDIEHYPQFLPWCSEAKIVDQDDDTITAQLTVAYKGFNETFTTRNTTTEEGVRMQLVNGPFKYLQGAWQLTPISDCQTLVDLTIDYEFKNKASAILLSPAFKKMGDIMVTRFCDEVDNQATAWKQSMSYSPSKKM